MKNLESVKKVRGQFQRSFNRASTKVAKIECYNERIKQYRQNRFFTNDQKNYGKTKESNEIPDADQSRVLWSGMWSESKEHNKNAEWQKKLKEKNNYQKQECLVITKDMVSKQSRKSPNWKSPGRYGVQEFWID